MCGIAGIFRRDGRQVDAVSVRAMIRAVAHRGCDGENIWVEKNIGLGHRLLRIRDLQGSLQQPVSDPTGRIIVSYNGEIYNYEELRALLSRDGIQFKTSNDAEVLPHAYLKWGEKAFEHLHGMFAVALWDREKQILILARDAIGIKPLYYYADGVAVRFGSEIKSVLADHEQRRKLAPSNVHKLLAMGYIGPTSTTLEDIYQVPPGHVLSFSERRHSRLEYWAPYRNPDIFKTEDALEELKVIFPRVISDHLVGEVPIGVLQSGGVDSSIVTLQAAKFKSLPLFTATFSNPSFDESTLATILAHKNKLDLYQFPVYENEALPDLFCKSVHHLDCQSCDEASIPLLLLAQEITRMTKVVLTGEGGDEFFCGHQTYMASFFASQIGRYFPKQFWQALGIASYLWSNRSDQRLSISSRISRFAFGVADDSVMAHTLWRRYLPEFLIDDVYGPELRRVRSIDPFQQYKDMMEASEGDLIDRCMLADQKFYLPGNLLLKTDAMTMAHSIEARLPFLDRRIMELSARCHTSISIGSKANWKGKSLLRNFGSDLGVPAKILSAAKHGFNFPLANVLRGGLRPLADKIFNRYVDCFEPLLEPHAVRRLWREHVENQRNHGYALWAMLTLGIWITSDFGRLSGADIGAR